MIQPGWDCLIQVFKVQIQSFKDTVAVLVKGFTFELDSGPNIRYAIYTIYNMYQHVFWGFAAIRLAFLEEPESEEEVIFNHPIPHLQTGWSIDAEDPSIPEDMRHHRDNQRKSKVVIKGNAQSDVAFSSPLVRWSLSVEEKAVGSSCGFCPS